MLPIPGIHGLGDGPWLIGPGQMHVEEPPDEFDRHLIRLVSPKPVLSAQIQVCLPGDVPLLFRQGLVPLEVTTLLGNPRSPAAQVDNH